MESGTGASASTQGAGRYRFGDTVVDAVAHTINRNGRSVAVEPKAFAVLLVLLRRAGQLVPRDELLDAVWGHRHVTPGVLTRAIAQLRNALDDQTEAPRYIQTRHAVGYRFIGDLIGEPVHGGLLDGEAVAGGPEPDAVQVAPAGEVESTQVCASGASAFAPARCDETMPSANIRWWKSPVFWVLIAGLAAAWVISDGMPGRPDPALASVAVMPFTNLGGDRDDDYFAEGLAVEMHDALAGVEGLKVAAQISSAAATAANADVKTLGRKLGVATVLDASVRREGRRMRINARLSDTATGYTLWSRSYDRELSDVFATQGEIADEVVRALMGVMPGRRQALARQLQPTRNVAAFDFYLRGLQSLRRSSGGDKEKDAIGFFNQALASDAGFSRAQAAICMAEARRFEYWHDSDAYARARLACARAADMDPALGEAALAMGNLHRVRGEYSQALAQYRKVVEDPRVGPGAHVGLAKVYAAQGKKDLARRHFGRALALRPGDPLTHMEAGWQAHLEGRSREAIDEYRKALALDPDNAGSWNTLGYFHLLAEDKAAAMRAFERSVAIAPNADALSNIGTLEFQAGEYAAAAGLYRKATELDPGDHVNWGNLGEGLLAVSAPDAEIRAAFGEAEKRVDRYLQLNPADGEAVAALGWYRVNLGLDADAEQLVRKSTAMEGDAAEIALYNAETLAALGRQQDSLLQIGRARQAGLSEARIQASAVLRGKLLAKN